MDYSSLTRGGLILVDRIRDHLDDPRSLRKGVDRGELIKLRRGAFVEAAFWRGQSPRQQHILRAQAVIAASKSHLILCGVSAAAVWGMPIEGDWPTEVSVLEDWKGGGRSRPGVVRSAANYPSASSQIVGGLLVTDLARTALDMALSGDMTTTIGSVDWALWRKNPDAITKTELVDALDLMKPRLGEQRARRAVGFATSLSDSFGESQARVGIHLLGFATPELQAPFEDSQGEMFVDFYWEDRNQVVEFDGKVKYTRQKFSKGDPGQVAWDEKRREDRLRKLGCGVTRLLTTHVANPPQLERLLSAAGIPRGGDIGSWREL